jgi:hypothetical protein
LGIFSGFRFTFVTLLSVLILSGILLAILFGILKRILASRKQGPTQAVFA